VSRRRKRSGPCCKGRDGGESTSVSEIQGCRHLALCGTACGCWEVKLYVETTKLRKSEETPDTYLCGLMRAFKAMIHHLVLDSQSSFKVPERGWLVPRLGSVRTCEVSLPGRLGSHYLKKKNSSHRDSSNTILTCLPIIVSENAPEPTRK
jgi:hypothetical protein